MNAYCAACGSLVPEAASICGRCASPVQRAPAILVQAQTDQPQPEKPQPAWIKKLGPFGAIAAAALKFKTVILLVASKALQFKALLSALAFFGVYWAAYGWRFAAGLVAGIYIHEMGHVWMIRRYGMRATMPMFIPGFGAFVSSPDQRSVAQGARIGLAGPLWGSAAAITFLLLSVSFPSPAWVPIVRITAVMNLFALAPIWIFDGTKGFRALDLRQRLYLMGLAGLLWYWTGEIMFAVFLLAAAYRVFWKKDHPPTGDTGACLEFAALLALLGALLAWTPLTGVGRI
jgi:Zn-dependent protease